MLALLDVLRQLYAQPDLDALGRTAARLALRLVDGDMAAYNELNVPLRRVLVIFDCDRNQQISQDLLPAFAQYMHQHPILQRHQMTKSGGVWTLSDFMTQQQWRELSLFIECYRHLGARHQIVMTLPSKAPIEIGVAINRSKSDFSPRDRLLLDLLRPHLQQAYEQAALLQRLRRDTSQVSDALTAMGRGLVVLDGRSRILHAEGAAQTLLDDCFPGDRHQPGHLPTELERWVLQCMASLSEPATQMPNPSATLTTPKGPLQVRLLHGMLDDRLYLVMEHRDTDSGPRRLMSLGLTPREAEVLHWVIEGKTNPQISLILGISPRTVQKHLERVFQKLNVETRTSASLKAMELLG